MRQSSGARRTDKRVGAAGKSLETTILRVASLGAAVLFGLLWFERSVIASATTRDILVVGGMALSIAAVLTAIALANVILPLLAERSSGVAEVLNAVAHGDLTRDPVETGDGPHDDHVVGATRSAIAALRSSIGEVRAATREVSSRAQDFGLQHASAVSAAQRATELAASMATQGSTLSELSGAAHEDVRRFAAAASRVVDEARAQRAREHRLRERSRESLTHLERSAASLEALSSGVSASAGELAVLTGASEEIRSFVILVRKMARQSKLLALNAAMEAARAGEHGSGFAVVAGEVRRLAKSSNEAADRTEQLVTDVLERIEKVRESSARAVESVRIASESNAEGVQLLRQLESETGSAPEPQQSGDDVGAVVAVGDALNLRLEQLSREAQALSHALQDASSGAGAQQSRLQELAAAINALARAATRAQTAANGFRSERTDSSAPQTAEGAGPSLPDALRGAAV